MQDPTTTDRIASALAHIERTLEVAQQMATTTKHFLDGIPAQSVNYDKEPGKDYRRAGDAAAYLIQRGMRVHLPRMSRHQEKEREPYIALAEPAETNSGEGRRAETTEVQPIELYVDGDNGEWLRLLCTNRSEGLRWSTNATPAASELPAEPAARIHRWLRAMARDSNWRNGITGHATRPTPWRAFASRVAGTERALAGWCDQLPGLPSQREATRAVRELSRRLNRLGSRLGISWTVDYEHFPEPAAATISIRNRPGTGLHWGTDDLITGSRPLEAQANVFYSAEHDQEDEGWVAGLTIASGETIVEAPIEQHRGINVLRRILQQRVWNTLPKGDTLHLAEGTWQSTI